MESWLQCKVTWRQTVGIGPAESGFGLQQGKIICCPHPHTPTQPARANQLKIFMLNRKDQLSISVTRIWYKRVYLHSQHIMVTTQIDRNVCCNQFAPTPFLIGTTGWSVLCSSVSGQQSLKNVSFVLVPPPPEVSQTEIGTFYVTWLISYTVLPL
jgi:hypothetical protein